MKKALICSLLAVSAMGVSLPAMAHHSFAMFDRSKPLTLTGTVVKFDWANPHSHLLIEVTPGGTDQRATGSWDIEANSPNIMIRQGWSRHSFNPGDKVTVLCYPLRDGGKGAQLAWVLDGSGKRLYPDVARPALGPETGKN